MFSHILNIFETAGTIYELVRGRDGRWKMPSTKDTVRSVEVCQRCIAGVPHAVRNEEPSWPGIFSYPHIYYYTDGLGQIYAPKENGRVERAEARPLERCFFFGRDALIQYAPRLLGHFEEANAKGYVDRRSVSMP